MRVIRFRGKELSGTWVEGHLIDGTYYLDSSPIRAIVPDDVIFYPRCEIDGWYEIYPETAGQFTGFYDKNGRGIFEGDIVLIGDSNIPMIIEFVDGSWTCICKAYVHYRHRLENIAEKYVIIGNIHDNPELIQGE